MFYRDLLIEHNVIINAHLHGITVGETIGLTIRNNTLVHDALAGMQERGGELHIPRINVRKSAQDVQILRNVTAAIEGQNGQSDWTVAQNLLVQDRRRLKPGYYGAVFAAASPDRSDRLDAFAPLPGGPLDGTGIGAERLQSPYPAPP